MEETKDTLVVNHDQPQQEHEKQIDMKPSHQIDVISDSNDDGQEETKNEDISSNALPIEETSIDILSKKFIQSTSIIISTAATHANASNDASSAISSAYDPYILKVESGTFFNPDVIKSLLITSSSFNVGKSDVVVDCVLGIITINNNNNTFSVDDVIKLLGRNFIYVSPLTRYIQEHQQESMLEQDQVGDVDMSASSQPRRSQRISSAIKQLKKIKDVSFGTWSTILAMLLSLISLISFVSTATELKWLSIVALVFSFPFILAHSVVSLKTKVILDSNILTTIIIIGLLALEDIVSAGFVSSLMLFSSWLSIFLIKRIQQKFQRIFKMIPEYTIRSDSDGSNSDTNPIKTRSDELVIGNRCIIKPNKVIPIDGVIESDTIAVVNESRLFGPSFSGMHKSMGEKVFAGTVNISNQDIIVRATSTAKESITWKRGSVLLQLQQYQAHWIAGLMNVEKAATIIFILIAILISTIPFYMGTTVGIYYLKIGLTLLGLACSCCCSTSAGFASNPARAAYMNGLIVSDTNGIFIKDAKVIDAICKVNTIIVNKTGTLTDGQHTITDIRMVKSGKSDIRQPNEGEILIKLSIPNLTNQIQGNEVIRILKDIEGIESVSIRVRAQRISIIFSESKCTKDIIIDALQSKQFEVNEVANNQLNMHDVIELLKICEEGLKKEIKISIPEITNENANKSNITVVEREELAGEGIRCKLNDGRIVYVGNSAIFKNIPELSKVVDEVAVAQYTLSKSADEELTLSESLVWAKQNEISNNLSIGWVIIDGIIISVFSMNDNIKNEACYTMNELHNMHMKLFLLTGATRGSCNLLLKTLTHQTNPNQKPKSIFAQSLFNLSPIDKKKTMSDIGKSRTGNSWKKKPYILAIDNDDELFDSCDVSIGMNGKDSAKMLKTSSITIPHTNLCSIEWVFDLCKDIQLSSIVGVALSVVLKVLLVSLTLAGILSIGVALLLDFIFYTLAWWNSSKIFNTKPPRISPPDENEILQLRAWRQAVEGASLGDTNASVFVPTSNGSCGRSVLSYLGVGLIVSVGYMDPGNWATDVAGGAAFGYSLMFIVLLSSLTAMFLQFLSLKIGIVTERDLAMAIHDSFHPYITFVLWIIAECAIAATDLAELLGVAIALNLLFKLPTPIGVVLTALDVFLILLLQKDKIRILELIVGVLTLTIVFCLVYLIYLANPVWKDVFTGLAPTKELFTNQDQLFLAIGIIGATVMPHNLFLHSGLVQTRGYQRTDSGKKRAIKFATVDSTMSLIIAFFVNSMILILAGATFNKDHKDVDDITVAYDLFTPILGPSFASIFFGVALFASGQQSSLTGTYAGQIVMEGMADIHIQPWKRRMLTRIVAMVPAVIVTSIYEKGAGDLLVISQVILSLALPFVIVPLVWITSDERKMGKDFVNSRLTKFFGWISAIVLIALNLYMISSPSTWQIGTER